MVNELLMVSLLTFNTNYYVTKEQFVFVNRNNYEVYPNDSEFVDGNQQYLCDIDLPGAWFFTTGKKTNNIGFIDFYFDTSNISDLTNRINNNLSNVYGSNQYVTDFDHGVETISIFGANTNLTGIAGVDWNSKIVTYDIEDSYNFITCINNANASNIKILSMSLNSTTNIPQIQYGIQNYNGLLISSAGNNSYNISYMYPCYPALYDYSNVISVGGLDENDNLFSLSNYGTYVDIYAPATNILTYNHSGQLVYDSGTSFAAPIVSGIASLILSINPNISVSELRNSLLNSADLKYIQYPDNSYHYIKKINAENAIKYSMTNYMNCNSLNVTYTDTISGSIFHGLHKYQLSGYASYKLTVRSQMYSAVDCIVFDSNFNELSLVNYSNNSYEKQYYLSNGTYYVLPKFAGSSSGYIDTKIIGV